MDAAVLLNLVAYSAQIAVVVGVGCALPALLRLDAPGVRFGYWRALVLLCLALPWMQTPRPAAAASAGDSVASYFVTGTASEAAGAASAAGAVVTWPQIAGALLLGGLVLRLLWMTAGLFYLRRLRGAGASFEDAGTRELQGEIGTRADLRYVPGLTQPVTFGVRRPVVLLPDLLRDHDPDIRRAIITHELVHVRRRDWAWIVAEELVRAIFWFNPAMWWLISRVQLAREEVVDELVVTITGKRRMYVEALLAFADPTPLAPAPAFARRRHLFRRMVLISKEAVMSSKRVVLSCAVMALVVAGGGWYAVGAFPMQQAAASVVTSGEPGPLEKSAKPITPENPIPRRLVSTTPDYPSELASSGARGGIVMRVTLDASGRIAEVRVVNVAVRAETPKFTISLNSALPADREKLLAAGLGETEAATAKKVVDTLAKAAVDGVRRWSYDPPAEAPISFVVSFSFAPDAPTTSAQLATPPSSRALVNSTGRGVGAGVGGGVSGGIGGGVTGGVSGGVSGGVTGRDTQWTDGALRVGGNITPPLKIRDVKPVYPPEAQAARISGVVIIEARIEPDGTVSNARVLRSVPMLDQAALDAVMQWQFVPTLLNGQAIPITMTMTVNFTLQ